MTKLHLNCEGLIKLLCKDREVLREKYKVKLEEMSEKAREEHENFKKTVCEEALNYLKEVNDVRAELPENDEALPEEAPNQPQQNHKNLNAEVENHLQETLANELQEKYEVKLEEMSEKAREEHENFKKTVCEEALNYLKEVNDVRAELPENDEALPEEAPNQPQQNHKNLNAEVENHLQETLANELREKYEVKLEEMSEKAREEHGKLKKTFRGEALNNLEEVLGVAAELSENDEENEALLEEALNHLQKTLAKVLKQPQKNIKDLFHKFLNLLHETLLAEASMHHTTENNKAQDVKFLLEMALSDNLEENQKTLLAKAPNQNRKNNKENKKNKKKIAEFANELRKTLYVKFQNVLREDNEPLLKEALYKLQHNDEALLEETKSQPKGSNTEPVSGCVSLFCEVHAKEKYLDPFKIVQPSTLDIKEGDTKKIRRKLEALSKKSMKLIGHDYEMIMIVIETIIKIIMFRYSSRT
ncbi:unnamed protein product [Trichogramma brassicae]|uniref:Uncharacterized protein n=1 Tax=Trichogramma brassicae TaxID=86971 RepID=A0A6H5IKW3_9HYME|nr:unnamed protein product [Trichogramma brassicae]